MRYASYRFSELAHVCTPSGLMHPADILKSFQRFYFDTTLSSPRFCRVSWLSLKKPESCPAPNFPFVPADVAASFTAKLDAYDSLTADEHSAISHRNAGVLFPSLVPKNAAPERPIA
jgi:hypothetical protein